MGKRATQSSFTLQELPTLRGERGPLIGLTLSLFALYAFTSSMEVALEDDAFFTLVADTLGVGHPPGYPLHSLLGKLFTLLPFGTLAYRVHLLSALCSALTCGVLYWLCLSLTGRRALSWIAAVIYGVSEVFWSQSIIAEVYSLNTLIFFSLFAMGLKLLRGADPSLLYPLAFVYGLGLANHVPLLGLSTVALIWLLWPQRRAVLRRLPLLVLAFFGGLLPYVWMVVRSQMDPPFSFYGPIESLEQFWFVFSRAGFEHIDHQVGSTGEDKLRWIGFFFGEFVRQVTPVGAVVGAVGFVALFRRTTHTVWCSLLLAFLASSVVLIALLDFTYSSYRQQVFSVFPLIAYGISALWVACGLSAISDKLTRTKLPGGIRRWAPLTLGVALALFLLYTNWQVNDRRGDDWGRKVSEHILGDLEPNAVLYLEHESLAYPLAYYQHAEGLRSDVELRHAQGLFFNTRSFDPFSVNNLKSQRATLAKTIAADSRPLYSVVVAPPLFEGSLRWGMYSKKDASVGKGWQVRYGRSSLAFLTTALDAHETQSDPVTRASINEAIHHSTEWLAHVILLRPQQATNPDVVAVYHRSLETLYGLWGAIRGQLRIHKVRPDLVSPPHLSALDTALAGYGPGDVFETLSTAKQIAHFYTTTARLAFALKKPKQAEARLQLSIDALSAWSNSACVQLLSALAARGDQAAYRQLREQLRRSNTEPAPSIVLQLDRRLAAGR